MKARYLFGLAIISALVAIVGLRFNATRSLELKNQIIQQDLAGQGTKEDINQLREFVFSHMNASVQFELVGSYERAVINTQQEAVTGQLYRQAQTSCDRQGVSSVDQAACVQAYLDQRLGNQNDNPVLPSRSQYRYAFASPSWSPDLAGWGLLGSILLLLTAVIIYIRNLFKFRLSSKET